jgi:hypothetical protein
MMLKRVTFVFSMTLLLNALLATIAFMIGLTLDALVTRQVFRLEAVRAIAEFIFKMLPLHAAIGGGNLVSMSAAGSKDRERIAKPPWNAESWGIYLFNSALWIAIAIACIFYLH